MRLGAQAIALVAFDPPGRPYPVDSTSTDLWFQHFAIIVSDMDEAYARLRSVGRFTPISAEGPCRLPPRSGGVTAFKFRDVEGHPLELLAFPPDTTPPTWRAAPARGLFLGIDHSAIAVSDTARSIAFYQAAFGLEIGARSLNHGPEQALLDAVPDATVSVTGLHPERQPTPHVELLGYAVGRRWPVPSVTMANDIAATQLVMRAASLPPIVAALRARAARFISPGVVAMDNGDQAIAVLDPDGHRIVVIGEGA
jgi:catechol 2,3-dioxygenase-like lactoylglutathione lyase family enzyme